MIRSALSIIQVLLGSARRFRENSRNSVAYEAAGRAVGWLCSDGIRERTKKLVLMGLDRFNDVARSPDLAIRQIASDIADNAKVQEPRNNIILLR